MSYARLLAALASSEFCEISWRACCRSNTLDAISDSEYVKCCSCDHGNVGCSMLVMKYGDILVLQCTRVFSANLSDGRKSVHSAGALSQYSLR